MEKYMFILFFLLFYWKIGTSVSIIIFINIKFCIAKIMATSKTWTQTLYLDPEKLGPWKTWTQKNLGSAKPGPWQTCTLKNLDYEKRGKQLDAKKKDQKTTWYNIEILLRKASRTSMMEGFPRKYLTVKSH